MSNDSLKKSTSQTFLKGAMIMTMSMVIVKLLGMFYKVFLTRLYANFGDELAGIGTGLLNNAYEVYNPLFALATAGFPIAVSRLIAESIAQKRYRDVAVIHKTSKPFFVGMGAVCFGLMIGISFVYVQIIKSPYSIYSMMTLAPSIFIGCLVAIYRGYYEGQRNMFPTAVSEVLEALGKVFLGLTFAFLVMTIGMNEFAASGTVFGQTFDTEYDAMYTLLAYSVASAIAGITLGSLIAFLFLRIYYIKHKFSVPSEYLENSVDARTRRETFNLLLKTAVPIGLSAIVLNLSGSIDTLVVQNVLYHTATVNREGLLMQFDASQIESMLPVNPTETNPITVHTYLMGAFSYALTIMQLVTSITQAFGTSALPNVTTAYAKGDKQELKKSIETVLKLTMLFTLPMGLGLFAIPYPVISLLYKGYSAYIGSHVLRVMGLSCIVVATSTPICSMLQGVGKISTPLVLTATAMVIKIATNYLFVSNVNLNITGAAVGSLVAFTYVCVVGMYILIRRAKVMPNLFNCMVKPLISAALCALTAYFSFRLIHHFIGSTISTLLAVLCAAIVYFFTLVILRTFTESELMMLPKGKNLVTILAKLHLLG